MAQNITLLGASYSDVPAVTLPKTGGGTALFADPSVVTAVASDVASGKYFIDASGTLTQGTASGGGGGGLTSVVKGTFKGTTEGVSMQINITYTGTGYPIAALIFPTNGPFNPNESLYTKVARYTVLSYMMIKQSTNTATDYSATGGADSEKAMIFTRHKSSTSSATTTASGGGMNNYPFSSSSNATGSGATGVVVFNSNKIMKVFIRSTNYGFAPNVEYTYYVMYSS